MDVQCVYKLLVGKVHSNLFLFKKKKIDQEDAVDEALKLFKANILFRNFEVKGPGDRLLIYETLFITKCLLKFSEKKPNKVDAEKLLYTTAIENFSLPGDKDFPLGGLVTAPKDRAEAGYFPLILPSISFTFPLFILYIFYIIYIITPF